MSDHLQACIERAELEEGPSEAKSEKQRTQAKKSAPSVSIATIVGGMSAQKQRRVLERGVDILVATPGRLWDLMGEVCSVMLRLLMKR